MLTRRLFLTGAAAFSFLIKKKAFASDDNQHFYQSISALEKKYGGRLGVAVLDTANGKSLSHRGRERFALCSTFKVLSAGFVLSRVDKGLERLDRKIIYQKSDLVEYSPVTEKFVGKGMSLSSLCKAAITHSDNTAANLMFDSFGGQKALTQYLRSLDDNITRLDRYETDLNDVPIGEMRDTTTPVAMTRTLKKLLTENVLEKLSRNHLQEWMISNTTGDKRLRAGLSSNWITGDKTGSGGRNETNDVAIIWPPGRAPLIAAVYYAESAGSIDERNKVIEKVGSLIAQL